MIGYIKMDLYKLFKSKYFYVCMLVFLAFVAIIIADSRNVEKQLLKGVLEEKMEDEADSFYTTGIGPNTYSVVVKGISLKTMMNATYGGNIMIFMALITLVLFVCNDFSGGYIKNTIVIPGHKWYANLSKMVIAFVIMTVQNILSIIAYLPAIKFYYETATVGGLKDLMQYLAVEMVLFLGISALFIFICDLTQSKTMGISLGVFISCQLVGAMLMMLLLKVFDIKAKTSQKIIISFVQSNLMTGMSGTELKEALILGCAAMLVYLTFANIVVCKKDY